MLRTEASLVDMQGPLAVLERRFVLALLTQLDGKIMERMGDAGIVRVENLLVDLEGSFAERYRLVVLPLRDVFSISGKLTSKPICSANNAARLLSNTATSGCSGPRTFSKIWSDRSKSGIASSYFPCAW